MSNPQNTPATEGRAPVPGSGKRSIELGALADPLTKQLHGLLPYAEAERLDGHAQAITRVHIHGLVSDLETDRARKRLMKMIQRAVTSHRTSSTACRPNSVLNEPSSD